MMSQWRHHSFNFYEILTQIDQGYFKATYRISFWSNLRELRKGVLCHRDRDLWPKVTNFNRVRASAVSNSLVKTASKSVQPFDQHFVHRWTDRYTHTQTNWSKNITFPRFCGGVKTVKLKERIMLKMLNEQSWDSSVVWSQVHCILIFYPRGIGSKV